MVRESSEVNPEGKHIAIVDPFHSEDEDSDEALYNAVVAAEAQVARKLLRIRLLEARITSRAADVSGCGNCSRWGQR